MLATPFTRPPGSELTTRPISMVLRATTSLPPTTIGSVRETSNVSPTLCSLVERVLVVRTFSAVPASRTTGFGAGGGAGAAGAEATGVGTGAGAAAVSVFGADGFTAAGFGLATGAAAGATGAAATGAGTGAGAGTAAGTGGAVSVPAGG
ncbi:MAG: hypothetical protein EXQ56_02130 [Acidobacteria bacterium]|nr:hypothetical protein [Acidobacteriota bacterium]